MAGRLLRHLLTWHDEQGAIHGVHTHPVWRIHPGTMEDHYTGYSAWGAPYLLGLADLVEKTGLPQGAGRKAEPSENRETHIHNFGTIATESEAPSQHLDELKYIKDGLEAVFIARD